MLGPDCFSSVDVAGYIASARLLHTTAIKLESSVRAAEVAKEHG